MRKASRDLFDEALPPVLLLSIDSQIGLTLIRELGKHHVRVLGVADEATSLGMYSRYLWRGVVREESEAKLLDQLLRLVQEMSPCFIMAISENDIAFLNRHRDRFAGAKLLIPSAKTMEIVLDKSQTRELGQRVGIPVPKVWALRSLRELEMLRDELTYPIVLKWADPLAVIPALRKAGLSLDKYRYCYDWDDLNGYLSPFDTIGQFPILQEFCPSFGLGQSIFMHKGQPLLKFQHRRIHEWPPEGGFSTLCEGVPPDQHADLMTKSVELLRAIGWEGVAMVEYRYDPLRDRAWLMEINGRFWGSLPLPSHSGAMFGWLTYQVKGLEQQAEDLRVTYGVKCRAFVTETKRLLRILFEPGKIQNRTLRFSKVGEILNYIKLSLDPSIRSFVFTWDDPKPAIMDLLNGSKRRWKELFANG